MVRVIGLDLDDVLMDFNTGLCAFHNAQYGTSLTREDITSYYLEEIWKCEPEEAIKRVSDFYCSPQHDQTQPVIGAVEIVKKLQDDRSVVIITSRPESVSAQTYAWLEKYFPSLARNVHFTSHFFHKEAKITKREVCRKLGVEVFVDDALFHAEDVALSVRRVFLFDTPWNRNQNLVLPNIQRVHSWAEINALLSGEK